jgi:hypothetical protein
MAFTATFMSIRMKNYQFTVPFLCIPGRLGGLYDSQPTNTAGVRGGWGVLAQSPARLLLVAWESYMTPSRTVTHVYMAARIRLNSFIFVVYLHQSIQQQQLIIYIIFLPQNSTSLNLLEYQITGYFYIKIQLFFYLNNITYTVTLAPLNLHEIAPLRLKVKIQNSLPAPVSPYPLTHLH